MFRRNLGMLYSALGQYEEGLREYQQAAEHSRLACSTSRANGLRGRASGGSRAIGIASTAKKLRKFRPDVVWYIPLPYTESRKTSRRVSQRMPSHRRTAALLIVLAAFAILQGGCRGSTPVAMADCTAPPAPSSAPAVHVQHVFIVLEENHSFSSVIGNKQMPYLNSLAATYAYAKGYYANTHPSIGNYFMLTTGQILTNDDRSSAEVSADNIVRRLIAAGKTWKEYTEDLPSVGYIGHNSGHYVEHHNPLSYFSDVRENSTQARNLVPFTQLAADLASHNLPNFAFVVPNNNDNGHDGSLAQADSWLEANIDPFLKSLDLSAPGGGLLIVVFDESFDSDKAGGGGHIPWVVAGPNVKKGFTSTSCYQHQSTLRFMSEALGLTSFPGAAAMAPDMREFLSGD